MSDFVTYLSKFKIKKIKPPPTNFIENEDITLRDNIALLKECQQFLTECFGVYKSLSKQLEDLIFTLKEFHDLRHYITRARYNFNSIICQIKNYETNYNKDNEVLILYYSQ